ncbi:ANTH domain-containing protein [Lineolata rhizophorae]|uniref:ANTH domain-containing protein n=1 Tax=Lineolata rhizophorae TaxID=578093 RepID=A0A6A6NR22_9PEZI|nr:ANTH domain-containing protein [Lineolata rhizophorae]
MSGSFEKSVKGGTKIKLAAPKSKYVEHILIATHTGDAGVAEIFRALQNRLRDSTWTIVFKSLIIVHLMVREGAPDVTLKFLSHNPHRKLAINNFTEGRLMLQGHFIQTQGRNIRAYSEYLIQRASSYGSTKVDYVRGGEGRLKRLTVEKGLLRETESVQDQIRALLRCDFLSHEPENEITLTAFRLLTMDLLVLFHVMNEGTINVLGFFTPEHYFEMSHPDAERALSIYRTFVKQTDQVVQYLSIAHHYEDATRLEIPKIKHAPTSLASSLEEYLRVPDFEINRRQYLAQQEAKRLGKAKPADSKPAAKPAGVSSSGFPSPKASAAAPVKQEQPKGPAPDLIDFFESIEQNQQLMAQPTEMPQGFGQQPQPTGQFGQQQQPAFGGGMQQGMGPQMTGFPGQQTGVGGIIGQQTAFGGMSGQQQQSTNPFDQQQQQLQQLQQQPMQQPVQQPMQQPSFTSAPTGFVAGNGFFPGQQQAQQPQHQPFSSQTTSPLQSIPQNGVLSSFGQQPPQQQQPSPFGTSAPSSDLSGAQSTNPFRHSVMPPQFTGATATTPTASSSSPSPFTPSATGTTTASSSGLGRSATNPFAKQTTEFGSGSPSPSPFASAPPVPPMPSQPAAGSPFAPQPSLLLQSASTGTNPFARPASHSPASAGPTSSGGPFSPPGGTGAPAGAGGALMPNPTGSTNPFRQSAFVNQSSGQGWQNAQGMQGTMGGLEGLETVRVFPRPGEGSAGTGAGAGGLQGQQQQQGGGW